MKTLPSGINTLTILTYIGCGLGLLGSIWQFVAAKSNIDKMEQLINSGDVEKMPAFVQKMYTPEAMEMAHKQYDNRYAMIIITLLSLALCFYGAMQMRKLSKQGFQFYAIGEILPIIGTAIFIGVGAFAGAGLAIVIIPVLFLILYAMQLKHLK
jgi:hypothetical protein